MNKNKVHRIAGILALTVIIASAAVCVVEWHSDDTAAAADFTGYIPISTPQELAKIGNEPAYPLDGRYYLVNDINFAGVDTNGGESIYISAVMSGTDLTVALTPSSGSVTALYASLGTSSANSSENTVTLLSVPYGVNVLSIGGSLSTGDNFAYLAAINTVSNGEKAGVTFNSNGNFDPIGNLSTFFTGTFDGNGHDIKGLDLSITSSSGDVYAGLFGFVSGALICNLGVVDSIITVTSASDVYVGGIAAAVDLAMIINCHSTGDITITSVASNASAYVGGIVGNNTVTMKINDCYSAINVSVSSSSYAYTGGIVGYGLAIIANCYNAGDILASASVSSAGGIVGCGQATIEGCYNTGAVSATSYAGGIVGYGFSATTVQSCYNTGGISSSGRAGGIVGRDPATITDCYNTGAVSATSTSTSFVLAGGIVGDVGSATTIQNCYNIGDVLATSSHYAFAGGIAGSCWAIIADCYCTGNITAMSTASDSSACAGGIVGASSAMKLTTVIQNCYFLEGTVSYNGIFQNNIHGDLTNPLSIMKDGGTGDQASGAKKMLQMAPTLQDARDGRSIYYSSNGGWDFSDRGTWAIVEGKNNGYPVLLFNSGTVIAGGYSPVPLYEPISVVPSGYTPIYNFDQLNAIDTNSTTLGGKYILMNDITFTEANNAIFVPIGNTTTPFTGTFDGNGYEIKGMNVNISSSSGDVDAGLFGYVEGAQICNLGVVDSTITAISTGSATVCAGSIVGLGWVTIENCYNASNITSKATATSSYAYAGGIVGDSLGTTIENCYSTGDIVALSMSTSTSSYVAAGGIVGYSSATIVNCYSAGEIMATSMASDSDASAGGIAGSDFATIQNCYSTGDVSATANSSFASAGGIAGSGLAMIQNCYSTGNVSATSTASLSATLTTAGGIVGYGLGTITMNCYNTGTVTAEQTSSDVNANVSAGGIVGNGSAVIINCYNTGAVNASSSSPDANAGGIAGYCQAILFNCYNVGDIRASTSDIGSSAYAGGIIGSNSAAIMILNCYFLEENVSSNGIVENSICGNLVDLTSILKDGGTGDQASGAKTTEHMTPTLQDAQDGNSIYFNGSGGWDFLAVWSIDSATNDGYPYFMSTVTKEDFSTTILTNSPGSKTVRIDEVGVEAVEGGVLVIPSTIVIDGAVYTVTEISANAFAEIEGVGSISIPSTITVISAGLFVGMANLKVVAVADGTVITDGAFGPDSSTIIVFYSGATSISLHVENGKVSMTVTETGGKILRRIIAGNSDGGHDLACTGTGGVWTFDNASNVRVYVHVYLVTQVLMGDVNSDGSVSILDVLTLRMALAGYDVDYDKETANLDGSSSVSVADVLWLRMIIAGTVVAPAWVSG